MYFKRRLVARNGVKAVVILGARISGCRNQKEVSLEDQIDHGKEIVRELYDGEADYKILATTGKGERLDRPELEELESLLRTETIDLVVFEDVGRLIRGADAVRLCGIAVDHGTRFIAPNDSIDTDDPDWEADVMEACKEHVGHNSHTSKRLKQKLMNRFRKFGGALSKLPYSYILPEGARTYFDVRKDPRPEVPGILQKGKEILQQTLNYSAAARYFNDVRATGGTSRRGEKWTGASIKGLYTNPILRGHPVRGCKKSEKEYETGSRRCVPNPGGEVYIDCPHLAYFTDEELVPLLQQLNDKNAHHSRKHNGRNDSRRRVPRKQTRFPGQFGTCWYCGSHFVWGGNGITNNLMCARSRESKCWNSVGFNGPLFVRRLMSALLDRLTVLQGFEEQFRAIVADSARGQSIDSELRRLKHDEDSLVRDQKNILDAIAKYGPQAMFDERMDDIGRRALTLKAERFELERLSKRQLEIPESPVELRSIMENAFQSLSVESPEFGTLLREIVPEFYVFLVRLCDGGHPLPRAMVRIDFSGLCPDTRQIDGLQPLLSSTVVLDVFEPPQRERIREQAVELIASGCHQREACLRIAERPKQPALQRALWLDRMMKERNLKSPYLVLQSPPDDYKKLRRYRTRHFRFEPLDGYAPPAIG